MAGVDSFTRDALEPFRAAGLHSAMYLVPLVAGTLALVLFAASFTVPRDMDNLQCWMLKLEAEPASDESVD